MKTIKTALIVALIILSAIYTNISAQIPLTNKYLGDSENKEMLTTPMHSLVCVYDFNLDSITVSMMFNSYFDSILPNYHILQRRLKLKPDTTTTLTFENGHIVERPDYRYLFVTENNIHCTRRKSKKNHIEITVKNSEDEYIFFDCIYEFDKERIIKRYQYGHTSLRIINNNIPKSIILFMPSRSLNGLGYEITLNDYKHNNNSFEISIDENSLNLDYSFINQRFDKILILPEFRS